jgi:hypothetical protein
VPFFPISVLKIQRLLKLTYVENTILIQYFMLAGQLMQQARQALYAAAS